ncbi:UNVERIFIED_CONTAM: hypothetical protein Sradi_7152100 [Sesamum radiatum]|uniref:Uncharacterized protein n=1 Tax=Sesamum radiatum TaxID=300843 RepID=A0AAW2IW52_SESRA
MDLHSTGPLSGRRRSRQQAAAAFGRLLDEEDEVMDEMMGSPRSRVDWGSSNLKTPPLIN